MVKTFPGRVRWGAWLAVAALMAAPQLASAAGMMIYQGAADRAPGGMRVGAWGSGVGREVEDRNFIGPRAIEVWTQSYYQGMRIDFADGLDLSALFQQKNSYLELRLQFPIATLVAPVAPGAPDGGDPGLPPGGSLEGMPGLPGAALEGMGGGPPAANAAPAAAAPPQPGTPNVNSLRIVLQTPQGPLVAEPVPLRPGTIERVEWVRVALPLASFQGNVPRDQVRVNRIIITGDRVATFWIGQIRIDVDDSPIEARIEVMPPDPRAGQPMQFIAITAGATPTRVAWDFDDANGLQADAAGDTVYHAYARPGEYTVTCTVSDATGQKAPFSATAAVRVEP